MNRRIIGRACVLVVGLVLVAGLVRSVSVCDFVQCESTPGETQRAAAERAAARKGRGFQLEGVLASAYYENSAPDDDPLPLKISFDFVDPSQLDVDPMGSTDNAMALALIVVINDAHPRWNIRLLEDSYTNGRPTDAFVEALAATRLSPAEAVQAARAKVPDLFSGDGKLLVGLDPHYAEDERLPDHPAYWSVIFVPDPFITSTRVRVDAQTGEVIDIIRHNIADE